jgi:aminoglycoside phosphotransferase (APT) family kinase protein
MSGTSSLNPSTDVRQGEALDWTALDAYLRDHISGLDGQPEISQYPSGNSNLTYRMRYPSHDLVVRRPPFGTRPASGHSMIREFRVMNALKPVFPAVPITHLHCADEAVVGSEFYVMERADGHLIHKSIPPEWGFTEADTESLCRNFWDKLAELHQVDYQAIGLGDFGKPEGYIQRQVSGWNRRYQKSRTDDVDAFEDVQRWLDTEQPSKESGAAVLHGDFRIDNLILDRDDPTRIVAILDWEICALGDPLMDLGNSVAYWVEAGDPAFLQHLKMQPSDAPGMFTRQQAMSYYAEKTGTEVSDFDFYLVYGYFRLAVILQQIYYRYYHGQTRDKRFAGFGQAVQALGHQARSLIGA